MHTHTRAAKMVRRLCSMGKTKRQTQSGSRGVDWFPTGLFTQRGCSSIAGSCASGKSGRQNTHHKSIGLNVCE